MYLNRASHSAPQDDGSDDGREDFGTPSPSKRSSNSSLKRRSTFGQIQLDEMPAYQRWMKIHYPKFVEFVEGNGFESAMGVIIMYNCLTIGVEVHECPPPQSIRALRAESCPETFLSVSENICTAIFTTEFMIRGLCSGFSYHFQSWDKWADVGLVWGTGVLLTWIIIPAMGGTGPSEVRMLTALRAFRLLRVARVIRFNFKEMWLMLRGLAGSSKALGSMIAVFVFVFYLFGILAVTLIADSTALDTEDEDLMKVHSFFNGLDKSMWTLLQMITADSWSSGIARPIINVIPFMWIYFVCYIAIAMMVLMNLVTAIIVENAMNQSKEDQESMLVELQKKKKQEFIHLEKMFLALDTDGSGELDEDEFADALRDQPEIIDQFKLLGFDEHETKNFFSDLDNGDGSLSTDEFISGLQAMQGKDGLARSADLIRTQKMIERLTKRMDKVMQHFGLTEGIHEDENEDEDAYQTPMRPPSRERETKVDPIEADIAVRKTFVTAGPEDEDSESEPDSPSNLPGTLPSPHGAERKTVTMAPERKTISRQGTGNFGGASNAAILENTKQQLEIAQDTSKNLDAMWLDIRRNIDEKLDDVQAAIRRGPEIDKQWLHEIRVSVAETCRKELARQLEKVVADTLAAGVYPPPPVSPPQALPSVPLLPKKAKAKSFGNRTFPGANVELNKHGHIKNLPEVHRSNSPSAKDE